jgi:prepilin-type processing-associated H-X9-DG protein
MKRKRKPIWPLAASCTGFMILVSATLPVAAQSDDAASNGTTSPNATRTRLNEVMAGRNLPLTIDVKDLNSSYRRFTIGYDSDIISYQVRMMGAKAGVEFGLYFTKGETITLGSETYLIAYRPQVRIDPQAFQNHGPREAAPAKAAKLRPNTKLALSLLNLRTTDSLNDIRPFDAKLDIESAQETTAASMRNLTLLGQGMLTYLMNRGNNTMPEMGARVTPVLQRRFYPYVHDQRLWAHPATEQPYLANATLSRQNVTKIANRKYVYAFAEASPGPDGTRGVLFLDGHVERVSAERWQRLQNAKIVSSQKPVARRSNRNGNVVTVREADIQTTVVVPATTSSTP